MEGQRCVILLKDIDPTRHWEMVLVCTSLAIVVSLLPHCESVTTKVGNYSCWEKEVAHKEYGKMVCFFNSTKCAMRTAIQEKSICDSCSRCCTPLVRGVP